LEPADSDRDLVRGWMAKMMDQGCAINSVCRKLSSLRAFFLYIKGKGIITTDPTEGLRGPKKRKQLPVFIKEEEIEMTQPEWYERKEEFEGRVPTLD
jgi:integrase/recombinase XerC